MPLPPITRPCPHCGKDYDISLRAPNARCWCRFCGKWFAVVMRLNGSVYLSKCDAPDGSEGVVTMTGTPEQIADQIVEEWYAAQDKPLRRRDRDRLRRAFSVAIQAERTAAEGDNAALLAEMSALRAELEAVKARERELRDALERLIHMAECDMVPGPNTLRQARAAIEATVK